MAHDVFISHARKDQVFASTICEKLESAHVRCWIAIRDISPNDDWIETTRNAIESSRVLVLVLSENANAAAHIKREIAHAFYTGCIIAPLRVSNTLPRRDFLFYLGNAPSFDAFGLDPKEPLDAFIASINGTIRNRLAGRSATPPRYAPEPLCAFTYSDSPVGGRRGPEPHNLGLWKCVAIAAALFALVWLLSSGSWGPKDDASPANADPNTMLSDSGTSPDSTTSATGDAPVPIPSYTSTRFGDRGLPPSDRKESADPSSSPLVLQPPSATSSPQPAVDQTEAGEANGLPLPGRASARSVEGDSAGPADRYDRPRKKTRKTHHHLRVRASEGSFIAPSKAGSRRSGDSL